MYWVQCKVGVLQCTVGVGVKYMGLECHVKMYSVM